MVKKEIEEQGIFRRRCKSNI